MFHDFPRNPGSFTTFFPATFLPQRTPSAPIGHSGTASAPMEGGKNSMRPLIIFSCRDFGREIPVILRKPHRNRVYNLDNLVTGHYTSYWLVVDLPL